MLNFLCAIASGKVSCGRDSWCCADTYEETSASANNEIQALPNLRAQVGTSVRPRPRFRGPASRSCHQPVFANQHSVSASKQNEQPFPGQTDRVVWKSAPPWGQATPWKRDSARLRQARTLHLMCYLTLRAETHCLNAVRSRDSEIECRASDQCHLISEKNHCK